jgi:hypothetical protein
MIVDHRAARETVRLRVLFAAVLAAGALLIALVGAPGAAQAKPYVCNLNGACSFGDSKDDKPDEPKEESAKRTYKFAVATIDEESKQWKYAGKLVVKVGPGVKFKFKPAPNKPNVVNLGGDQE